MFLRLSILTVFIVFSYSSWSVDCENGLSVSVKRFVSLGNDPETAGLYEEFTNDIRFYLKDLPESDLVWIVDLLKRFGAVQALYLNGEMIEGPFVVLAINPETNSVANYRRKSSPNRRRSNYGSNAFQFSEAYRSLMRAHRANSPLGIVSRLVGRSRYWLIGSGNFNGQPLPSLDGYDRRRELGEDGQPLPRQAYFGKYYLD